VAGAEAEEEEEGGAKRLSNAARKRVCSSAEKGCYLVGGKEEGVNEKDWLDLPFLLLIFQKPPPLPSFYLSFANSPRPGAYAPTYLVDWLRRSG